MDYNDTDESILGTGLTSRDIEAFSRKVTATASHLVGPIGEGTSSVYQNAMTEIHRELRRPGLQRSVFSFVQNSPREAVRAKLSTSQIQHRALTFIPDELLKSVPEDNNTFSLFQGFQATLPTVEGNEHRKKHRRHHKGQKLLEDGKDEEPADLFEVQKEKDRVSHKLEMMGIRKSMCSAEIVEIDKKIANLNSMRKIVLDRLADLEDNELKIEQELTELEIKVEEMQELAAEEEKSSKIATPTAESEVTTEDSGMLTPTASVSSPTFMSQSIYEKLPSPNRPKRGRPTRRKSMPIRHEHLTPGTMLQTIPAHNDMITALDFDAPFGTMVSAALDDTVRVWDLNQGRCLGLLEGHRASVRCLQVEDNLVATGSIDASVKLWDLSLAEYSTATSSINKSEEEEAPDPETPVAEEPSPIPSANMANTLLISLEAHVSEITALHFHKQTLVSGSADKTLRQWDLVKGRCVQTLDILWAATQAAASTTAGENNTWRSTSRLPDASADFVGALQIFDAALACGTADGLVRLWDLRSGQVSRSLVGHTGPVTCLQFDDVHLVTGSADRSIRIWDLRTGAIFDAFGYDSPITSMMFDSRRIVSAAGESVVKVYDKGDGQHWDVGTPESESRTSVIEQVRIKDGFLVGGRRSGEIGLWAC